jgi:hypothetical protein
MCLTDGRQSMATSLLGMLMTSTTSLADVLTIINASEVACGRSTPPCPHPWAYECVDFSDLDLGGVLNPSRVNVKDIS